METKASQQYYDTRLQQWARLDGQEVCQDHTGLRATCPFKHDGRRNP